MLRHCQKSSPPGLWGRYKGSRWTRIPKPPKTAPRPGALLIDTASISSMLIPRQKENLYIVEKYETCTIFVLVLFRRMTVDQIWHLANLRYTKAERLGVNQLRWSSALSEWCHFRLTHRAGQIGALSRVALTFTAPTTFTAKVVDLLALKLS